MDKQLNFEVLIESVNENEDKSLNGVFPGIFNWNYKDIPSPISPKVFCNAELKNNLGKTHETVNKINIGRFHVQTIDKYLQRIKRILECFKKKMLHYLFPI